MLRCALSILLGVAALLTRTAQTPTKAEVFPVVSISLPLNIPSETVQISYFMSGPFGGYGGYTEPQTGVRSYEISATVEGKAATEIRVIAYAPGCEIQKFAIPLLRDSKINQPFLCQAAATVKLSGQIVSNELVRDHGAELVVAYMAYWAHRFYGISDGMVTEFRLATVVPDAEGKFQVELTYFSSDAADSSQPRAGYSLSLRDSETGNHIGSYVEPQAPQLRSEEHNLRIQPQYPESLKFILGSS